MPWTWDTDALQEILVEAGFDVERISAEDHSLAARRERADAVQLLTLDTGGRLKLVATTRLDERAEPPRDVAGLVLRPVSETVRTTTVVATLTGVPQLGAVLTAMAFTGAEATPTESRRIDQTEQPTRAWWHRWRR